MPRAKGGAKTRQRRKKVLKQAKGNFGGRRKLISHREGNATPRGRIRVPRSPSEKASGPRALDRPHQRGMPRARALISVFMHSLKKAGILLDRKILAELGHDDPAPSPKLAEKAKS